MSSDTRSQSHQVIVARVAALRAGFDTCAWTQNGSDGIGIDAFLVPRCDAHQGEYVPPHAERLAWVSGFTGSAGYAVIARQEAAVFSDGRYTLQACREVPSPPFERHHSGKKTPRQWASEMLPKGSRIGYDPWLISVRQYEQWQDTATRFGFNLHAVHTNPIDAVRTDCPASAVVPARPYPLCYAGEESIRKREKIAERLRQSALHAAIITAPDSIAWLLNVRGSDLSYAPQVLSFALIYHDASVDWFVDQEKITADVRAALDDGVRIMSTEELASCLGKTGAGVQAIGADMATLPVWMETHARAGGARMVAMDDLCLLPKALKNVTEQEGVARAHVRDGIALAEFYAWLEEALSTGTVSELDCVARMETFRKAGDLYTGPSFPTIAGSGPNGAVIHYRVNEDTNRFLTPGDLFLMDSGGQYWDGTTDVTRTIAIGTPSSVHKDAYTRVLKGHIALARARFPMGVTGTQLDPFARHALWEVGLDYDHGTGHGVGCYANVHEGPQRISKAPSTIPLAPGMVISNEPGYYVEGAFGIRIENLVLVVSVDDGKCGEGEYPVLGFETLTLAPFEPALIERTLLSRTDVAWINAYHRRVYETLQAHVTPRARGRLQRMAIAL